MAAPENLQALVDQMPDPDGRGMYTENIDKAKIEQAIARIHAGGRDNILGLIQMLGDPGSAENVKPHYALHCLANHVLIIKDEAARQQFSETLAAQLDGDLSDYNKAYLCQELQWAGRKEAAPALGKLLLNEALTEPASMALVAIGDGAAEQFLAALPKAEGKCRLNVIQGLAAVANPDSREVLIEALSDEDPDVRIAAGRGLARLGDPAAADALLAASGAEPGWERIQATKHCLILAEKLAAGGQKEPAAQIYRKLREARTDPSEWYIRDAAEKALAAL